jgi:DNA-binding transcriptional regulator YiaG
MPTKLSLREALEQRGKIAVERPGHSAFPVVRTILRAGSMPRPVEVLRTLRSYGLSLRKAHDALNRLAAGKTVALEVRPRDADQLVAQLAALGVSASVIRSPKTDVRSVREHMGLPQAEFAIRYNLELDTVQNWEQGRNRPGPRDQLLLKLIEMYPDSVESALTGKPFIPPYAVISGLGARNAAARFATYSWPSVWTAQPHHPDE